MALPLRAHATIMSMHFLQAVAWENLTYTRNANSPELCCKGSPIRLYIVFRG